MSTVLNKLKYINTNKIFFLNDNETISINMFKFKLVFEQPLFNEHSACIIEDNKHCGNSNDSVIEDFSIKNTK